MDEGIHNVTIIAIGKSQHSEDNNAWLSGNSIPILIDSSPDHFIWNSWNAYQRALFFLDKDGNDYEFVQYYSEKNEERNDYTS